MGTNCFLPMMLRNADVWCWEPHTAALGSAVPITLSAPGRIENLQTQRAEGRESSAAVSHRECVVVLKP